MIHPEEKEHLDYNDLTHSEVSEYVDGYFWGDDEFDEFDEDEELDGLQ